VSGRSPLDGISLLIVDGNNLLHRTAGGPGPSAARVLIPRLRAIMPVGMRVSIILDGMPDPGAPLHEHIGSIAISHAGRRSADDAIVEAVERRAYDERPSTIVVTDDRGLADRIKRLGALHRRIDWLQNALDLSHRGSRVPGSSPAPIGRAGIRQPAAPARAAAPAEGLISEEQERAPWSPGRGATKKRGNPRRRRSPR
jgi:hypothetical protein